GVVGLGQTAKTQTLRLAAAAAGCRGVLRFLRAGYRPLLVVLRPAGDRRRLHVRALWSVLRHRAGNPSRQRGRWCHGVDQQPGRPGFVRGLVPGWLPQWRHRHLER
nr:hypothetical protein [Tanacetum cinerariifolium]